MNVVCVVHVCTIHSLVLYRVLCEVLWMALNASDISDHYAGSRCGVSRDCVTSVDVAIATRPYNFWQKGSE